MLRFKLTPHRIALAVGLSVLGTLAVAVTDAVKDLHLHVKPRTKFGPAAVLDVEDDDGNKVRVLAVGKCYQSATYLGARRFEPVFAYYRAFDAMRELENPPTRVCMIGGGAYSYAKHAMHEYPEVQMDVVEIDPEITELAKRYFFLNETLARLGADAKTVELNEPDGFEASIEDHGRLRLVCADGRAWIEHADVMAYDAVVNDAFSGAEMPESLRGVEFFRSVKRALAPSGLYLVNVVANGKPEPLSKVRQAAEELSEVFNYVWIQQADDDNFQSDENYVLIASDAGYAFLQAMRYE